MHTVEVLHSLRTVGVLQDEGPLGLDRELSELYEDFTAETGIYQSISDKLTEHNIPHSVALSLFRLYKVSEGEVT